MFRVFKLFDPVITWLWTTLCNCFLCDLCYHFIELVWSHGFVFIGQLLSWFHFIRHTYFHLIGQKCIYIYILVHLLSYISCFPKSSSKNAQECDTERLRYHRPFIFSHVSHAHSAEIGLSPGNETYNLLTISCLVQVPLGIFLNNENKHDEMVNILESLCKYVPTKSSKTATAHPVTHGNTTIL